MSEATALKSMKDALAFIANLECMVELSIATVINGMVNHEYIAITSAPPKVIDAIMKEYPFTSLKDGKLLVPVC